MVICYACNKCARTLSTTGDWLAGYAFCYWQWSAGKVYALIMLAGVMAVYQRAKTPEKMA